MKLPSGITNKFGRQALKLQKASPQIMFAAGVVGVVGAGVLACRATLRLSETLEESEKLVHQINQLAENNQDYADTDYKSDLVKSKAKTVINIAKLYLPATALTIVSIGLLTGSHVTLNRRNAAVTAAYAGLKQGYDKYRERVVEKYGADEDRKFQHGVQIVEETVATEGGKTKVVKHEKAAFEGFSPYAKLFCEGLDMWRPNAELNRIFLQCQQNYMNELLRARGHVFLNDVYDALGIERTSAGAVVGWALGRGGDDFIDFGVFDDAHNEKVREFVNLSEASILLDFNVDGVIYDLI